MSTPSDDIGDLRRLSVTFTDLAGTPADPTGVAVVITEPDGIVITKNLGDGVVNDTAAAGAFYYDFAVTKAGRHAVRWTGTGALVAAAASEFYVRRKETLA